MGLDDSVLKFADKIVHVHPFYGWGWQGYSEEDPLAVPEPFRTRVIEFWISRGERRGGIGRVEEPGHTLNELWVVFSTRHLGIYNFEDAVDPNGGYNIGLSDEEPSERREEWPISTDSSRHVGGYADIVAPSHPCKLCELAPKHSSACTK